MIGGSRIMMAQEFAREEGEIELMTVGASFPAWLVPVGGRSATRRITEPNSYDP